jgi:hypothetical protein
MILILTEKEAQNKDLYTPQIQSADVVLIQICENMFECFNARTNSITGTWDMSDLKSYLAELY